jgi:hypothetical protein
MALGWLVGWQLERTGQQRVLDFVAGAGLRCVEKWGRNGRGQQRRGRRKKREGRGLEDHWLL